MPARSIQPRKRAIRPGIAALLGLACAAGLLLALGDFGAPAARAANPATRYLDGVNGNDAGNCADSALACRTLQYAVDAADPGDEIRAATGVYTGVHARAGITQVLYISKTLVIRGGYTGTDWGTPYPITQPTTLDAQNQGRALYVDGAISVTIEGLHITGGNAAGLVGDPSGEDAGGGVYVVTATLALSDSRVYSNVAEIGGGLYVLNSAGSALTGNTIAYNTGLNRAGGAAFRASPGAMLANNSVSHNVAYHLGGGQKRYGGVYLLGSDSTTWISNTIEGNVAADLCGGVCLVDSDNAILIRTTITGNHSGSPGFGTSAGGGGALFQVSANTQLIDSLVLHNSTYGNGGGLWVWSGDAVLSNTVVADNDITSSVGFTGSGSALYLIGSARLLHNTIARNDGGDGSGVYVTGTLSSATLTNTILVSHALGLAVGAGSAATLDGVLWYGNAANTGGSGTLVVTNEHVGDPAFTPEGYHLTAASQAINQGANAGVMTDIDGQPRPVGLPDFGVDEFALRVYLPFIAKNYDPQISASGKHPDLVANGSTPALQLLAYQPSAEDYRFTVRLSAALSHTQYVISSYHHTDIDYWQAAVTVTTDSAGLASARVWSRCRAGGSLSGYVFARVEQSGTLQSESSRLECPTIHTVAGFGSHLTGQPGNDDWIYRPVSAGPDSIRIWIQDEAGRSGLTGTVSIRSAQGYALIDQPLVDEGNGLYAREWFIAGLPRADDYRVQLTLSDGANLSGADAFVKLSGRAMWVWGKAGPGSNPAIEAILTNQDYDMSGTGDRDEWLAFSDAPYEAPDPYVTTSYLSVFPSITFTGTLVTDTIQTFLAAAHASGEIRVEALAGTHEWVESDSGLQEGKGLCDAILDINRAGSSAAERFDGIHYDVEHDDWYTGNRWSRFLELIAYCQARVNGYNQTHGPIVFGVDIPPHFVTGPASSGQVESGWDVLSIVDAITLMDYRDYASVRWDGRSDGIIPRAQNFLADANALGKSVFIGVELTSNPYDHVTFFEECPAYMENELRAVSRYFAGEWSYKGIAMHGYEAWSHKASCEVFIPIVLKND